MSSPELLLLLFCSFLLLYFYLNLYQVSKDFDYIIAGGGCAGLSLAKHLTSSTLRDKKILIVDSSPKTENDKTWCYWAESPFFPELNPYAWEDVQFYSEQVQLTSSIAPLKYFCVNSLQFYRYMHEELSKHPNVTLMVAKVLEIEDEADGAVVYTSEGNFSGQWIFNSIVGKPTLSGTDIFQRQHFMGWRIETENPLFDPASMTLMDFRIPQEGQTRFVYCLPFSPYHALIEFTVFSETLIPDSAYKESLSTYMDSFFPNQPYNIIEIEKGSIPMTTYQFPRTQGMHIVNIGTAGGLTKPTTGYTFANIQEDSRKMVEHLISNGSPLYPRSQRGRYIFYDTLLLYLIKYQGHTIKRIFELLFKRNSLPRILSFLEEKSGLLAELSMLVRLPWPPFLRAIWKQYLYPQKTTQKSTPVVSTLSSQHP